MTPASLSVTPTGGTALDLLDEDGVNVAVEGLELPIPAYDESFAIPPGGEGGPLITSTAGNAVATVTVWITGASAAAFWANIRAWQEAVEGCHRDGGELAYTPVDGEAVTYEIESARITEMPQVHVFQAQEHSQSTAEFVCRPYARLAEQTQNLSIIDNFSSNTITNQDWIVVEAGAGLTVGSGVLSHSTPHTEGVIYWNVMTYESTTYLKISMGDAAGTWSHGVIFKRLDDDNFLHAKLTSNYDGLSIDKRVATVDTHLANSGALGITGATDYWLKVRILENVITVNVYETDPNGANPTASIGTVSHTLTGGDATAFGTGVRGQNGVYCYSDDGATYDDYRMDSGELYSTRPILDCWALDVPGSAPAETELVLTDAENARKWATVRMAPSDPTGDQRVLIDSDSFSLTGCVGGQAYQGSSHYNPKGSANDHITMTLTASSQNLAWSGALSHYGSRKIRARLLTDDTDCYVRAEWFYGDSPTGTALPWVLIPGANYYFEVDLTPNTGIFIPPSLTGSHYWSFYIQAYTPTATTTVLWLDYAIVEPASYGGKAYDSTYLMAFGEGILFTNHGLARPYGSSPTFYGTNAYLAPGDNQITAEARREIMETTQDNDYFDDLTRLRAVIEPKVAVM